MLLKGEPAYCEDMTLDLSQREHTQNNIFVLLIYQKSAIWNLQNRKNQ